MVGINTRGVIGTIINNQGMICRAAEAVFTTSTAQVRVVLCQLATSKDGAGHAGVARSAF